MSLSYPEAKIHPKECPYQLYEGLQKFAGMIEEQKNFPGRISPEEIEETHTDLLNHAAALADEEVITFEFESFVNFKLWQVLGAWESAEPLPDWLA